MRRAAARWIPPVVSCAVATVVAIDALSYPPSLVPGAPGPAFFPRLLAGLLFALGIALAVRAGREGGAVHGDPHGEPAAPTDRMPDRDPEPREDEARASAARLDLARVAGGVAAIGAFLWLAPWTGTFVLLPVLVAALMGLMGERRPASLIGVPLAFALFVYLVFYRAFGVAVPTSLF